MNKEKDSLTSLFTYESAREKITENDFFNKHDNCQLILIYVAGLSEMVTEYGSAFAMTVLHNQAELIQNFFERHTTEAIFCRITKDCFAVVFSEVKNTDSVPLIHDLYDALMNSYYGRTQDYVPMIRMGLYHFTDSCSDFRQGLIHAGAAIYSIPEGESGIAVYYPEMETTLSYIPSEVHSQRLPAEDLTDYDSSFIAFAVHMLSGSRDLDSNTDLVIQKIGMEFGFDQVLISEFLDDTTAKVTNKWIREEGIIFPIDEVSNFRDWDGFLVGYDKRGVNIALDVNDVSFSESDQAFFKEKNIRSFINILLYSYNAPIGYISCSKRQPMKELDSRTLSTLAHLSRIISSYVSLRNEQSKQMDRIQALSIDNLTGLYTYAAFQRHVRHRLHHCKPDKTYAFISADISHFSNLNENFGYAEGDHVLKLFSKKLKAGSHEQIISCHLEADRFLLFAENDSEETLMTQIRGLCDEFEEYLNKRYPMSNLRVVSGIYFVSNPNKDLLYMIDSANHARKSIKHCYAESVAVYSDELRTKRKMLLDVVGSIHDAIEDGYIEAFLQPKFSMVHRNIIGAEALVRWRNPDNTYRFPDQFIPILEDAGLIVDLDMCVFRQALDALARWKADGKKLIPISVNFSRVHFRDENFYKKVVTMTKEYGIDTSFIEVEVTESTFGENRESLFLQLQQLRKHGFIVDIDDFGTGYSSLNMLMSAPVDIVKVDKSFIDNYETKEQQVYINQIGNLILSADKDIIFEGVETEEQIKLLTDYGYDRAQGYFFSRPIPLAEFEQKYVYQ